eukprot:gb/GEZJ01004990.1/.p1 GENE.gb/GEZJ01004990.1/~~gb/GEZJ01004990.1/.p1  ORF type:complete len:130 (-),score=20.76 gb/GEZJ01004990.1/:77-466(-)
MKEMLEEGVGDRSKMKSPSAMLEALQQKYPDRYCLPGEEELNAEIYKFFKRQKDEKALQTAPRGVLEIYAVSLRLWIEKDRNLKLARGFSKLKKTNSGANDVLPSDLPTDNQVKGKVSSSKASLKKVDR